MTAAPKTNNQKDYQVRKHSTPKRRNLIAPNLQAIEERNFTESRNVIMMLKPSERESIFDRIVVKRISTPEAEAATYDKPRSLILHTLHVVYADRIQAARTEGRISGKIEALANLINPMPPNHPAGAAWPVRRAA